MFTGIITDLGQVRAISGSGDTRFRIGTGYDTGDLAIGASVAHSGVCLTVIEKGGDWFDVQVSAETLARSTLGGWQVGTTINLERSLKLGDEFGGHIVSGHVDAVATIVERRPENESVRFTFEVPPAYARSIASKGSVALNGVSLTVNEVEGNRFGVNIIPHTLTATTFGTAKVGDKINFEIDMLARYVARLLDKDLP